MVIVTLVCNSISFLLYGACLVRLCLFSVTRFVVYHSRIRSHSLAVLIGASARTKSINEKILHYNDVCVDELVMVRAAASAHVEVSLDKTSHFSPSVYQDS